MNTIIWALLTGVISGGIWIGIVVLRQQHELDRYDPTELAEMERRLAELDQAAARIPELEERVEFAERMLASSRDRDLSPERGVRPEA